MDESDVYVIRVYRRGTVCMTGLVESVASGEQLPFRDARDLWRALLDLPSPRRAMPFVDILKENKE